MNEDTGKKNNQLCVIPGDVGGVAICVVNCVTLVTQEITSQHNFPGVI